MTNRAHLSLYAWHPAGVQTLVGLSKYQSMHECTSPAIHSAAGVSRLHCQLGLWLSGVLICHEAVAVTRVTLQARGEREGPGAPSSTFCHGTALARTSCAGHMQCPVWVFTFEGHSKTVNFIDLGSKRQGWSQGGVARPRRKGALCTEFRWSLSCSSAQDSLGRKL